MSERAFSLELKTNLSAQEAWKYSLEGKLNDERAFHCCDPCCEIPLTCTNWNNKNGKRIYFVLSHNDELHVIGCKQVSRKEIREQIGSDVKSMIKEINNNGLIIMLKTPDKNTKQEDPVKENINANKVNEKHSYISNNQDREEKYEGHRSAIIESFIELFKRDDFDKDEKRILVDGKKYSINDLFIRYDTTLKDSVFGIFYGEATIKKIYSKEKLVAINFLDSSFPPVYTNEDSLDKIENGNKVKKYIDTDKSFLVYFRGMYNGSTKRFEKYNDKFYKDLFFDL